MVDDKQNGSRSKVAIIAGGGSLPVEVAEAAISGQLEPLIIAIKGEADPAINNLNPVWVEWGQIGKMLAAVKSHECRDLVLIGGISRRPDFGAVATDVATIKRLPRILKALIGGDGDVLSKTMQMIEDEGFRVIGAHEIAPQLLAEAGNICGKRLTMRQKQDLDLALGALDALGLHDIGQGAVVANQRIIAVEAAEGTDLMLDRCAELRRLGRISKGSAGLFVKAAKPDQDERIDLPTIGPKTIDRAASAGLSGIAVEAGKVLIAERPETLARAGRAGLFLHGFQRPLHG